MGGVGGGGGAALDVIHVLCSSRLKSNHFSARSRKQTNEKPSKNFTTLRVTVDG